MQPTDTASALFVCLDEPKRAAEKTFDTLQREEHFLPATPSKPSSSTIPPPSAQDPPGCGIAESGPIRILTILVPILHNPDQHGHREPVDARLIDWIEQKLLERFGGFRGSYGWGKWLHMTGVVFRDDHIKYEIEGVFDAAAESELREWKVEWAKKLRQIAMYFTLAGPVVVL